MLEWRRTAPPQNSRELRSISIYVAEAAVACGEHELARQLLSEARGSGAMECRERDLVERLWAALPE